MIVTVIAFTAGIAGTLAAGAYAEKSGLVARLTGHSVEFITKELTGLRDRLDAAVSHHSEVADSHRAAAAASEAAALKAQTEAVRAAQVADKVGALLA